MSEALAIDISLVKKSGDNLQSLGIGFVQDVVLDVLGARDQVAPSSMIVYKMSQPLIADFDPRYPVLNRTECGICNLTTTMSRVSGKHEYAFLLFD